MNLSYRVSQIFNKIFNLMYTQKEKMGFKNIETEQLEQPEKSMDKKHTCNTCDRAENKNNNNFPHSLWFSQNGDRLGIQICELLVLVMDNGGEMGDMGYAVYGIA